MSPLALAARCWPWWPRTGPPCAARPGDGAPAQAILYRGDWLEVRGEVPGFLKVWDHRRERGGYVRPTSVRVHRLSEACGGGAGAVVRFLRDAAGFESLGIGYAALYMKVAPAAAAGPARVGGGAGRPGGDGRAARAARLGTAPGGRDRARRRAGRPGRRGRELRRRLSPLRARRAHGGLLRRRRLRARAAAAGRPASCAPAPRWPSPAAAASIPAPRSAQRRAWNDARLDILAALDPALASGAGCRASPPTACACAPPKPWPRRPTTRPPRAGRPPRARSRAPNPCASWPSSTAARLAPEDLPRLRGGRPARGGHPLAGRAARASARRRPSPSRSPRAAPARPACACVRPDRPAPRPSSPCDRALHLGVVLPASLRLAPSAARWRRWPSRRCRPGPSSGSSAPTRRPRLARDVVPPGPGEPGQDIGYVELAGFSPDGRRLLVARELRTAARLTRRFELLGARQPPSSTGPAPRPLPPARWASPTWRQSTLALR